jgi:hypothetical protein
MKNTLVIGASTNPERYSNIASLRLRKHGHEIVLFGQKAGEIDGIQIETKWNQNWEVDSITLYVGPKNQAEFYGKIIDLKPRRVIFNPGTENPEFFNLLRKQNIEVEVACTLVLLSLNSY